MCVCVCVCVRVCLHSLPRWRREVYQCSSIATHCNTLQHTATHRTTLQHTTPLHSLLCRWSVCVTSGFIYVSTCALVYVYVSTRLTKSFTHVMYVPMALASALLFLPMLWLSLRIYANEQKWGGGDRRRHGSTAAGTREPAAPIRHRHLRLCVALCSVVQCVAVQCVALRCKWEFFSCAVSCATRIPLMCSSLCEAETPFMYSRNS